MNLTEAREKELKSKYQDKNFTYRLNEDLLREDINLLERKLNKTDEESKILTELIEFRANNCHYPGLAYYDLCEISQLFD